MVNIKVERILHQVHLKLKFHYLLVELNPATLAGGFSACFCVVERTVIVCLGDLVTQSAEVRSLALRGCGLSFRRLRIVGTDVSMVPDAVACVANYRVLTTAITPSAAVI